MTESPDLNLVVLAGRLAAPPAYTPNPDGVTTSGRYLVIVRGEYDAKEQTHHRVDVLPVTWRDVPDSVLDSEDMMPGVRVWVAGEYRRRFITDDTTGERRSITEVIASQVCTRAIDTTDRQTAADSLPDDTPCLCGDTRPVHVCHNGITITDYTTDETGRFPVGPDYYREAMIATILRSFDVTDMAGGRPSAADYVSDAVDAVGVTLSDYQLDGLVDTYDHVASWGFPLRYVAGVLVDIITLCAAPARAAAGWDDETSPEHRTRVNYTINVTADYVPGGYRPTMTDVITCIGDSLAATQDPSLPGWGITAITDGETFDR